MDFSISHLKLMKLKPNKNEGQIQVKDLTNINQHFYHNPGLTNSKLNAEKETTHSPTYIFQYLTILNEYKSVTCLETNMRSQFFNSGFYSNI